jgi:hypothetical protein
MPDYRIYRIKDHRIAGPPEIIAADSDEEAVERAKPLMGGLDIEIWERPRFVRGIKMSDIA